MLLLVIIPYCLILLMGFKENTRKRGKIVQFLTSIFLWIITIIIELVKFDIISRFIVTLIMILFLSVLIAVFGTTFGKKSNIIMAILYCSVNFALLFYKPFLNIPILAVISFIIIFFAFMVLFMVFLIFFYLKKRGDRN